MLDRADTLTSLDVIISARNWFFNGNQQHADTTLFGTLHISCNASLELELFGLRTEGTERMESELFRCNLKTVGVSVATHGSLAVIEYLVFVKTCI